MQEPKRYKIVTANGNSSNVVECKDGHWVNFHYYEKLKNKLKELESAELTLKHLSYENLGGEMWKPPIGKVHNFINEIKDSDIIEMINSFREEIGSIDKYHEEILIMFIRKIFRSKKGVINASKK